MASSSQSRQLDDRRDPMQKKMSSNYSSHDPRTNAALSRGQELNLMSKQPAARVAKVKQLEGAPVRSNPNQPTKPIYDDTNRF